MLIYKQKKNQPPKGNRILISVTVPGSAGPIRFVVKEKELVSTVIDIALKTYAREGRLPVLGTNRLNNFMLYCHVAGSEALFPWDTIASVGVRNFILCKKPEIEKAAIDDKKVTTVSQKGSRGWMALFHKTLNNKIYSHRIEF